MHQILTQKFQVPLFLQKWKFSGLRTLPIFACRSPAIAVEWSVFLTQKEPDMRSKYYPPAFQAKEFHCALCGVFASQIWCETYVSYGRQLIMDIKACHCSHCDKWSYWHAGNLVVPSDSPAEPPHPDLPKDCAFDYCEARDIFSKSPRAAAALLRLCIQKLMAHLGEKGSNINDDIGSLVAKGLPKTVQRSLDYCRVVGNNAVHPGAIDLKDSPEIAQQLFGMINFIVEDRISRPQEIEKLYQTLPEGARAAIEKRDEGTLAAGTGTNPGS
jgi:hypothetical protein